MTIYALQYHQHGRDVVERFDSMTARNLRIFALPVEPVKTWLEDSDIEARNQAVLGRVAPVGKSA